MKAEAVGPVRRFHSMSEIENIKHRTLEELIAGLSSPSGYPEPAPPSTRP
jgi:hypothetical protein